MFERQKTTNSMYGIRSKKKRVKLSQAREKIISEKTSYIGIGIGILLTLITIVLQCIALFTPHWKEISPNTHSLYVDGVDALIRTEILYYFNSVHRYTRHSYGLFQRCEYPIPNSSKLPHQFQVEKTCTKNYLPLYNDDYFNQCHSLPYYRFCTKTSATSFDINNDYLRATFDISYSNINTPSTFSCDCHYPSYASACQIIGIIGLILLILTCVLFSIFPFFTDSHYRLKIKCFGVLAWILTVIFLIINLIIVLEHLEYESVEYLIAIQRHYKLNQIYKLSQDTKTAIDRFLTSIQIHIGYSTILAWIAFGLTIIDGILLLFTCKIKYQYEENETRDNLINSKNDEHPSTLIFTSIPPESSQSPYLNSSNEKIRVQIEDEV